MMGIQRMLTTTRNSTNTLQGGPGRREERSGRHGHGAGGKVRPRNREGRREGNAWSPSQRMPGDWKC